MDHVIGKMINFDQAVQKNVLPGLDILFGHYSAVVGTYVFLNIYFFG